MLHQRKQRASTASALSAFGQESTGGRYLRGLVPPLLLKSILHLFIAGKIPNYCFKPSNYGPNVCGCGHFCRFQTSQHGAT